MRGTNKKLFILQCFVALMAIPAGLSLVLEPDGSGIGLPLELIKNSPFKDFLIPGLFLLVVNGMGQLAGSFLTYKKNKYSRLIGTALGIFLVLWILVQLYFEVGYIHFLQLLFLIIGILEIWLAKNLSGLMTTRPTTDERGDTTTDEP